MNEEIIEKIAENGQTQEGGTEQTSDKRLSTWLIFAIAGKKFAIRSSEVLEIIGDMSVYRLPFMPAYIEGVLNRRGDPFTVINPLAIIESTDTKPPEEPLFLILKRDDDQLAIHISDILFFTEMDEADLNLIPNNDEEGFFLGTLGYGHDEIPVMNPSAFEILIRKDLGSA